jgi:ATP-dependent protease ClpP protease subunit
MRGTIVILSIFLMVMGSHLANADEAVFFDDSLMYDPCKCEDKVVRSMEVKNHEGELSHFAFITDGVAHYKLFANISMSDTTNLWQDLVVLKSMGIKELFIYINSGGGSAYDGLGLADVIAYGISEGVEITTVAVGVVASAAVPVFASGQYRVAMPNAQFMVHQAKLGKYLVYESIDDMTTQKKMMEQLESRYIGILVDNSNVTREEWEAKIKVTTYFGSEEAKEWGLVHEIK